MLSLQPWSGDKVNILKVTIFVAAGPLTSSQDAGSHVATPLKSTLYCLPVPPKEPPQEECQPHPTRKKKAVKYRVMCSENKDITSLQPNISSSEKFTNKELKVLRCVGREGKGDGCL